MKNRTKTAFAHGNGGSLPSGWQTRNLGALASEVISRNARSKMGREHVLSVDNERGLVPSDRKLGEDFGRYKLIGADQFAYNPMRLNVGSIALKRDDVPALVSPDYVVFKCCEDALDPLFFDFYRRTDAWKDSIVRSGQGSVRIRYYFHHIADFPIGVPPLREQRAIAGVLRTVQAAKEACERVIAATRQLKHSLLAHLFTYGPIPFDQADKVQLRDTDIGSVPEHWETDRLGENAVIGNGSTPKRTDSRYWDGGTIPWLTSGKVHDGTIHAADELVTETARRECHLPLVPTGSLVVAITGQGKTLGNSAILAIDACVSQHLAYVTLRGSRLLPGFVLAFLRSRYDQLQAVSRAGGSTKGALTCGYLKSFVVPVPPPSEQQEIAAQLSGVDAKLAAEESRRDALASLFASLLRNLMTGRVRLPEFAGGKA